MCTVTYLPTPDGYIFTSNRDESPKRATDELVERNGFGHHLVYPVDKGAGGTWIAISNEDRLVCILNGAFEAHPHRPPYRRSRGLMALDYFAMKGIENFFAQYMLNGMEPFTMVTVEKGNPFEFRWDGNHRHLLPLAKDEPYLWSSSTLYDQEAKAKREGWFLEWLQKNPTYDEDKVWQFHQTAGANDPYNGYIMNRDNVVRTVSITQISKTAGRLNLRFMNLLPSGSHAPQTRTLAL